jgi:mRNA interferase MazF
MTRYSQGDVVLLRYPFTDLLASKQRPAVIISADWFNALRNDYVLVASTSQIPPSLARDELSLSTDDLAKAGLPKPSIVKLGKIATLEQSLVLKRLGTLPQGTLGEVLKGIGRLLGRPGRTSG